MSLQHKSDWLALKESASSGIQDIFPVVGSKHILDVVGVQVADENNENNYREQLETKLRGKSWTVPIKGEVRLLDKDTGRVLDKSKVVLGHLPKLTDRYSYIVGGMEYQIDHLWQRKPGVYSRISRAGEIESEFNLEKGKNFKLFFNPAKRDFTMEIGKSKIPLYHVLTSIGVSPSDIAKSWGKEVVAAASAHSEAKVMKKLGDALEVEGNNEAIATAFINSLAQTQLSPETTELTLGKAFDKVTPDTIMRASSKLLKLSRGEEKADDRDALIYKTLQGVDDKLYDRLAGKNKNRITAKIRNRLDRYDTNKEVIGSSFFNSFINQQFSGAGRESSTLANMPSQLNPVDWLMGATKTTVLAPDEGGISSEQQVTNELKEVNNTHVGFLDPITSPEGSRAGMTLYLPVGMHKEKGNIFTRLWDVRNKVNKYVDPIEFYKKIVAFPDQVKSHRGSFTPNTPKVKSSQKGNEIGQSAWKDVDYVMTNPAAAFSVGSTLIPFMSSNSGGRVSMGARHMTQSISIKDREAPLVQVSTDSQGNTNSSWEEILGGNIALKSTVNGKVTKVTKDHIHIQIRNGDEAKQEIYDNFPLNEDGAFVSHIPLVKEGDSVKVGDILADSNNTKDGVLALGKSMRTLFGTMPGKTYEDGVVISATAAKKLSSDKLYRYTVDLTPGIVTDSKKHRAYFPTAFKEKQINKLGDDGMAKKGQILDPGDPIITVLSEAPQLSEHKIMKKLGKGAIKPYRDASQKWDGDVTAEVVDVVRLGKKATVLVKAIEPMKQGDKLSNRFGGKGVVTEVLPDSEMPRDAEGNSVEVVFSPLSVPGRTNVGIVYETVVSKVAKKLGKPINIPSFGIEDHHKYVSDLLKKHKVEDKEEMFDSNGRSLGKMLVGNPYILRLKQVVDDKYSERSGGPGSPYDVNRAPTGHGGERPQALGSLEHYALLSHGARSVLADASSRSSDADNADEVWRALQMGLPLPPPKIPFSYKKFEDLLRGLGVNVDKKGNNLRLLPMTDQEVRDMSSGEIRTAETVISKNMKPVVGGIFDSGATGGLDGSRWCFHPYTRIITDLGILPIRDIVENRLSCKVLSYNIVSNSLEYSRITNFWRSTTESPLIGLDFDRSGLLRDFSLGIFHKRYSVGMLWCTKNHEIYTKDFEKIFADDAKDKKIWTVAYVLNSDQRQLIFGTLLGDASLKNYKKSIRYSCKHGEKQRGYLEFKMEMLSPFVNQHEITKVKEKSSISYMFNTKYHIAFSSIYATCYKKGKKLITNEWLDQIDSKGLAFWFSDDGNVDFIKNKIRVTFSTECFSKAEIIALHNWLKVRWNLRSTYAQIKKYAGRDMGYIIRLSGYAAKRLIMLVAPYINGDIRYKILRNPYNRKCKICGSSIASMYDVCDICVLSSIKATPNRQAYLSKKHPLSRSAIFNRYGSWGKVVAMANNMIPIKHTSDALVTYPWVGVIGNGIGELSNKSLLGLYPIVVSNTDKSANKTDSKFKTVYNIEVENNHNYFANGILVGNSHIHLHESMPNPIFEDGIRALTGLSKDELQRVIRGEAGLPEMKIKRASIVVGADEGLTGPSGLKKYMDSFNVKKEMEEIRDNLKSLTGDALNKAVKRYKILNALHKTGMRPSDAYMMQNVPVVPPMLRPLTIKPDGNLSIDPLNELYRGLIISGNTFKVSKETLPESQLGQLREDIYGGLSALMGMSTRKRVQGDELKGVLDTLSGDQPKFSFVQNQLIHRRQDLSARSVITADPTLGLDEVGIPRKMAMAVYKPFVIRELGTMGIAPLKAQDMIKVNDPTAMKALDRVVEQRPVLLKRDPVLHKHGIVAVRPKLHDGKEIALSPLIFAPMGADLDGDSLAIYTPISMKAVKEAWGMLPSKNLFSAATGKVVYAPSHESLVGTFKMTTMGKSLNKSYKNVKEAEKAFYGNSLGLNDVVNIGGVKTTVGRAVIYNALPAEARSSKMLTDPDFSLDKKGMDTFMGNIGEKNPSIYSEVAKTLFNLGSKALYDTGFSFGMDEIKPDVAMRKKFLDPIMRKMKYMDPKKMVEGLSEASTKIEKEYKDRMKDSKDNLLIMSAAGGKPSINQYKQLVAAPVLFADFYSRPIPTPITQSYAEGLDFGDYWTQSLGARKGVVSKTQEVRDPGAMTKRMVNTLISTVVTDRDCGTTEGEVLGIGHSDLVDRYLSKGVDADGVHIGTGSLITPEIVNKIRKAGIKNVTVRSALHCHAEEGICSKCIGVLSKNGLPEIGTNVGTIAAQSIGERATQLSMKLTHEGGAIGKTSKFLGAFDRVQQILKMPENLPDSATLSKQDGKVTEVSKSSVGGYDVFIDGIDHYVPGNLDLTPGLKKGSSIKKGSAISSGSVNPRQLLEISGIDAVRNHMTNELDDIYNDHGVRRRHMEVLVRGLTNLVQVTDPGEATELVRGEIVPLTKVRNINKEISSKITYRPILKGIDQAATFSEDWLARMNHVRIKDSILESVNQGLIAKLHSLNPVASMIRGDVRSTEEGPEY